MRFLVFAKGYPMGGPETSVYFTTQFGFASLSTDTPASVRFMARIEQALDIQRDLISADHMTGKGTIAVGNVKLKNLDGALDYLLDYGFDGREVQVWYGAEGATITSGYTQVLKGTIEQPLLSRKTFELVVRDRGLLLEVPLQTTKYTGAGGLNGTSDLTGKPVPKIFGSVRNAKAWLVDPVKLIYQFADGALNSIDIVRDAGFRIGSNYGTQSTLGSPESAVGNNAMRAIAYVDDNAGNKSFIAVGDGGKIEASTNGTSWAAISPNDFGGSNIYGVAYRANQVILVGDAGKLYTFTTANVGSGLGTSRTSGFGASAIRAIYWWSQKSLWVIVGDGGKISTSTDGATWTSRTSGVATALYAIAASAERIVVVGAGGVILHSADGTTWTALTNPGFGSSDLWSAVYGKDRFVVGGADDKVGYALDGLAWSVVAGKFDVSGASFGKIHRGMTLVDGKFISVGDDGCVATSLWGDQWTLRYAAQDVDLYAIAQYATGSSRPVVSVGYNATGTTAIFRQAELPLTYANTTDLQDDTLRPKAGSYGVCLSAGLIRLGARAMGDVTGDVVQGAASSDRTATSISKAMLQLAGLSSGDWSASDYTALTSANSAVLGFATGLDEWKVSDAVDWVLRSVGAWWTFDRTGVFRTAVLTDPTSGSSVATILDVNMKGDGFDRIPLRDPGLGIPVYKTIVRYSKNYNVQTGDLARNVDEADRAALGKDFYDSPATDASVQTKHTLSRQRVIDTLIASSSDAATEAARLQALWGVDRNFFEFTLPLTAAYLALDLGQVITLKSTRFGLSAGKKHVIAKVAVNAQANSITLGVWG